MLLYDNFQEGDFEALEGSYSQAKPTPQAQQQQNNDSFWDKGRSFWD